MTEKMQADDVLSRQAVFVRCCPNLPKRGKVWYHIRAMTKRKKIAMSQMAIACLHLSFYEMPVKVLTFYEKSSIIDHVKKTGELILVG